MHVLERSACELHAESQDPRSTGPCKVVVHDYAGHPFQAELSRELAHRGFEVIHAFFAQDRGPKGDLEKRSDDAAGLVFAPIEIDRPYSKDRLLQRRSGDLAYGQAVARLLRHHRPAVVLSGNTPTDAQEIIQRACRESGSACVPWVQDFYSIAVEKLLARRIGMAGRLVGAYYRHRERQQFARADAIVIITEQFRELAEAWSGEPSKVFTIENWGALSGIAPQPRTNAWSLRHQLDGTFNFLYSGTLGLKHNPELLAGLALRMRGQAHVVVVGQGTGMDQLQRRKARGGLENLVLLPVQPFSELPQVLGSADVAVAVIEPEAGIFSVPSKVQSYLCAGRAVLLAAPGENLAAQVVQRERAGLVTAADDADAFYAQAQRLFEDASLRSRFAANGRAYAENAYGIGQVADKFQRVFANAMKPKDRKPVAFLTRQGVLK
jgi:colanic acid biosynthesis glycosyl transferase WcaI